MAYFEMDTTCERCGETLIFVSDYGKRGAIKAAKSHGWHFAVANMAVCPECQKPGAKKAGVDENTQEASSASPTVAAGER